MTTHQQHRHEYARMTVDMPFEEHKRLKEVAAMMGIILKDLNPQLSKRLRAELERTKR